MRALAVTLLGLALGYWAGVRGQRYAQARADVHDARGKLTKARKARRPVRFDALAAWLLLGVIAVLALATVLAT